MLSRETGNRIRFGRVAMRGCVCVWRAVFAAVAVPAAWRSAPPRVNFGENRKTT